MAMFHVYVEGPVDASPEGVAKLADAIAATYGLPAADLQARMAKGRFRVKANVDRATAETYMKALQAIGARVQLDEAHPTQPVPVTRPASSSLPPATAPARPSSSSLPPATAPARPASSSLPPATAKPKAAQLQSGLSAAFSGDAPAASSLGALEDLSLASLDGKYEPAEAPVVRFTPPSSPDPAAPAAAPSAAARPAKPSTAPLDLFAPPDAAEGDLAVELATDEVEHRARKSQPIPVATEAAAPATGKPVTQPLSPPLRRSAPSIQPPTVGVVAPPPTAERARFAAGVFLAILVGFVPAHFVASARERSVFRGIDTQVETAQASADTPDMYAQLDAFRDAQLGHKKSEQRSIAMMAMVVWAVVGGAVAFGWFRLAPWNRTAG